MTTPRKFLATCLFGIFAASIGIGTFGCGSGEEETVREERRTRKKKTGPRAINPDDFKPEEVATHEVKIYTPVPGFFVLVDNGAARDAENKRLKTPCAINVAAGRREIRITHPKFRDDSRLVDVEKSMELNFSPFPMPDGDNASVVFSSMFEAPVGKGIPMFSINTVEHNELDPFVEPDGLAVWFVSDRPTGTGIYRSSRPTPYHQFDEPRFEFRTPGSGDLPAASPCVNQDALMLVYTSPDRGEIWGVPRANALAPFDFESRMRLKNTSHRTKWPAVQITYDSSQLFWVVDENKELKTFVADRASKEGADKLRYGTEEEVDLPGIVPCLSSDGLRHFSFDGKTLKRSVRPDSKTPFSKPETKVVLSASLYTPVAGRRQFFVTDDEQWLFYVPDVKNADIWVARLMEGRGWGTVARGRTIDPKVAMVAAPETPTQPTGPVEPQIDPRTLELSYTQFDRDFRKLLSEKRYDEAEKLLNKSKAMPRFALDKEPLSWDQQNLDRIKRFWDEVHAAAKQLKVGDEVKIGSARVRFIRFENGVIIGKSRTKDVSKVLVEMAPVDLAAMIETDDNKEDAEFNMRVGTYYFFDAEGNERSANVRFEKAGALGKEFEERIAGRVMHRATREFDRENATIGRTLLSEVQAKFPKSAAATQAKQREGELWKLTKWTTRGPRKWVIADGDFSADNNKQAGSFLISDKKYEAFELQLEWKTVASATAYGGVFFRYSGNGRPSDVGFKVNLANDYGAPADNYCTGSLFKVEPPSENAVKQAGQWNSLKLRVNRDEVQLTINGRLVLETIASDADSPLSGYIALDGDLGGITYRKPLLMEIPVKKPERPTPPPAQE